MAETTIPTRIPDYRLETIEGEMLLFHPARGTVLYCNETASLIWQLCDGQRTAQELVEMLVQAYPEEAASIPADVESVLQIFAHNGAIEYR